MLAWGEDVEVRVATFNVRMFPSGSTDLERVVETIVAADVDVMALQEIAHPMLLEVALASASERTGRDLVVVRSACDPDGWFINAIVYDAARWHPVATRDYPALDPSGDAACSRSEQSAVLGVFADEDGNALAVLSVHLHAYPRNFERRQKQWVRALEIARDVEEEFDAPTILMGDMNSTGFTGEPGEERDFVHDVVDDAGFELVTSSLQCTEYWRPSASADYVPSILDHIVVGGGTWAAAEVQGYCARLACRPTPAARMDPDYHHVSDHCPVVVRGTLD